MDANHNGFHLVFPKSHRFLRVLQQPEVNRLIKHGWTMDKTLFLDCSYVQTHLDYLPAQVGSWVMDAKDRDVYYNLVLFTRGYVSEAHQIELEDTILHETHHLTETITKLQNGELPHPSDDSAVEAIWREEQSELAGTTASLVRHHGLLRVSSVLAEADCQMAHMKLARSIDHVHHSLVGRKNRGEAKKG
jgi:hypothetical protein